MGGGLEVGRGGGWRCRVVWGGNLGRMIYKIRRRMWRRNLGNEE